MNNTYKILIVEDEVLIAEDLSELCQSHGHDVIEIAYNAGQAVLALKQNSPEIVLLDINISDEIDGIEIAQLLDKEYHIPYIFITSAIDDRTIQRVKKVKHQNYIVKPFNDQQVIATIEIAMANSGISKQFKTEDHSIASLTEREQEVLSFMLEGLTMKDIGDRLFLSRNTIKYYQKNIYLKLDIHSRAELFAKMK